MPADNSTTNSNLDTNQLGKLDLGSCTANVNSASAFGNSQPNQSISSGVIDLNSKNVEIGKNFDDKSIQNPANQQGSTTTASVSQVPKYSNLIQNLNNNNTGNVNSSPNVKSVQISASDVRFANTKYKIFGFGLLIVFVIFAYPYLQQIQDDYNSVQISLNSVNDRIVSQKTRIASYTDNQELLDYIKKNQSDIVGCINGTSSCDKIDKKILDQKDTIRIYYQLQKLEPKKMDIDEQKILKNINEFLLKGDSADPYSLPIGVINSINIGDETAVIDNLYKVPVHISVTFETKDEVTTMLDRIENKIAVDDKDGLENATIYNIDSINYDVMHYEQTQDVEVDLKAYYMK